jgi:pterin-4a-carbinolamine dehydratase
VVLSFTEFNSIKIPESLEAYAESLVLKLGYINPILRSMSPGAFLFKVGFHYVLVLEPESKLNLISSLTPEYPKQELGGFVFFYITNQEMPSDFLYDGKYLISIFKFDKFQKSKKFIEDVLELANRKDHYPIIEFDGHNKVTIKLYTFDLGMVSEMDTMMADEISKIKNRINDIFIG